MIYFTHPNLKFSWKNIIKIVKSFVISPDIKSFNKNLIFTDMGRSAFRLIIEKLNLRDTQMLLPAYICDIFQPILKEFNIAPVFLDIDLDTFNINLEQLKEKINPEIKSILICHTYGLPNNIASVKHLIDKYSIQNTKYKILIIEDFSHSFGSIQSRQYIDKNSDAGFCSLYKQFPCLRGGVAVFRNQELGIMEQGLPKTNFNFRDFVSLLNYFSLFAFLFKKFGSQVAPKFLRKGKQQISGLSDVSLNLFSFFLNDLEKNLEKRISLALYFQQGLKKLNFSVQKSENNIFTFLSALVPINLTNKRDEIIKKLGKRNIFCSRIWSSPIALEGFPNTTEASKKIINFPLQNHYTKKDIDKMLLKLKLALDKVRTQ